MTIRISFLSTTMQLNCRFFRYLLCTTLLLLVQGAVSAQQVHTSFRAIKLSSSHIPCQKIFPSWKGEIATTYHNADCLHSTLLGIPGDSEPQGIDHINFLELTHGKRVDGRITLLEGSRSSPDAAPEYLAKLPTREDIIKCKTKSEILKFFEDRSYFSLFNPLENRGARQFFGNRAGKLPNATSSVDSFRPTSNLEIVIPQTEFNCWTHFVENGKGQLRYMCVLATFANDQISSLTIREGVFSNREKADEREETRNEQETGQQETGTVKAPWSQQTGGESKREKANESKRGHAEFTRGR